MLSYLRYNLLYYLVHTRSARPDAITIVDVRHLGPFPITLLPPFAWEHEGRTKPATTDNCESRALNQGDGE